MAASLDGAFSLCPRPVIRRLRARLAAASILALLAAALATPAAANGGSGGNGGGGDGTGGAGGIDDPTGAGGAGSNGTATFGGGGGGGAGAVTGGAGGFNVSGNPGPGQGGTGGVHGSVGTGLPAGVSTGSNGGAGNSGTGASGGGGGGAGGYGAVVTGAGTAGTITGAVTGGNGGVGGSSVFDKGGSGGSGGIGLLFTSGTSPTTLVVNGTVQGGTGGAAGVGGAFADAGAHGLGGFGIVGSNLHVTNNGTIAGGLDGGGGLRSSAIVFTAGDNSLTFGNASSGLSGEITVGGGTLTFAQPTDVTVANVISGAGSVIKTGAGMLVLTGTNDYSGATQVLGGRLVADDSGAFSANSDYTVASGAVLEVAGGVGIATIGSLSGAGFVRIGLGGVLVTGTTNQITTFSGTLLGDGSLDHVGTGTQILSGTGSNLGGDLSICSCGTGQLVLRGGDLTVGGFVSVEAGTLVVEQGAKLTSASSFLVAGTARITGAGSAVTIANDTIVVGALSIEQGGALDSGTGTTTLAGTVLVSGTGSSLKAAVLLVQNVGAPASLTIAGGGSVISGGAALTGFAGPVNALVTGAGSLWSVGGGGLTLGGPFSNDATSVTVADGGTLVVTSGDLQIDSLGTLNIGNGGKAGTVTLAAGAILNDGAIVANFTDTATLAAVIDGTGTLTKRGSGTLTLTGASTYTGATTVSGGKLVVNGSLTGAVTIDGGALGGSGTVGGIAANAGGTVAPGNSIGTLNVAGNISFASGSTYQVEINPAGQSDKILASGLATISGGTVQVLAERGTYAASTSYTILTAAGGVSGRFADVTSDLVFLTPSLAYGSNNVVLTMTRTATTFVDVAATRNQGFIANAAEALGVGNPIYDTLLSGTAAEARAGFDLLSGEAHAQAVSVMIDESRLVRETILNRLRGPLLTAPGAQVAAAFSADLPGRKGAVLMNAPQPRYTLWGEAFGGAGNTDADGNAGSLSRRSGGALLGADLMLYDAPGSSLKLGVAGGYSQSRFDLDARRSSGKLDSGHAALYAGGRFGNLRLDAGLAYSWSESDIRRQVQIRGFGDSLRLQRPGAVAQGFAELGYGFALGGFALEPFAQLALIRVSTDAGTERGGAAALRVLSSDQTLGFTTLGLRAEAQLGSAPLFARAMLGWRHGFGELTPTASTAFALGTTPARVFAAQIDREALVAEAGLDWRLSSATALGLTYSAAIGERSRDHALKGRVEMRF